MNGRGSKELGNRDERVESPDAWLERRMRELYVGMKANNGSGKYASRNIANAAHGLTAPHRSIAKRMREARRARVKAEFVKALALVLGEYADRLYGRSKELNPAA